MKTVLLAAFAASIFLPVAAENLTPTVEKRTPTVDQRMPPVTTPEPAKAADKATTPRETARIAKAQNKDMKCATKQKQPRQKKATAT